ncbi:WG repeat-containing protein [Paenibacillus rhizoplanae]
MQGNLRIPLQYKYTNGFYGGLAPVLVGSKYGFINKTGSIVIDPVFLLM